MWSTTKQLGTTHPHVLLHMHTLWCPLAPPVISHPQRGRAGTEPGSSGTDQCIRLSHEDRRDSHGSVCCWATRLSEYHWRLQFRKTLAASRHVGGCPALPQGIMRAAPSAQLPKQGRGHPIALKKANQGCSDKRPKPFHTHTHTHTDTQTHRHTHTHTHTTLHTNKGQSMTHMQRILYLKNGALRVRAVYHSPKDGIIKKKSKAKWIPIPTINPHAQTTANTHFYSN